MRKQLRTLAGVALWAIATLCLATPANAQSSDNSDVQSARDFPPDTTQYFRPAVPDDYAPGGRRALGPSVLGPAVSFPSVFVADVVVNNTDPNLQNTDTFPNGEPSIAVNRSNQNQIDITAFSGAWPPTSPVWDSTDGGFTWTKQFTIPAPPGVPSAGCPCDQTIDYDYDFGTHLFGTFLTANFSNPPTFMPINVYSGSTTDPTSTPAWNWRVVAGVAQRTNSFGVGNSDQPWLLVNTDPVGAFDDVYVAYDDFSGAPDMRVAAAVAQDAPNFTIDSRSGFSVGAVNPGHRLAVDPRSGAVYSLFQRCPLTFPNCFSLAGNPKTINYMLNRSTDGGLTWTLNGSATGIIVATAQSTQPQPKFGTVNALLGGVDHAAVDPNTGDVYVVYGNRDPVTTNNRLSIVRLTDDGLGGLAIGPSFFVTGQVQAALPSVAVTADAAGTVGVLYDTFDGLNPASGLPMFSAHFAISQDQGMTFSDVVLESFLSPAANNGDPRQRVLGDYQQLKAACHTFYGVFAGNGVPFGRPFANIDPIFFTTDAP